MTDHFFSAENYALGETLRSGQAFRWRMCEGRWESVVSGRWVQLIEQQDGIHAFIAEDVRDWGWLAEYLQASVRIADIVATFPKDLHLQRAVQECGGLRLLRQDPWECLASFILSSTKQIVQIQQIVELICQRHGEEVKVPLGASPAYSFPTAERISELSEAELRACKMGFRAPYLKGTAEMIASGAIDLEKIRSLDVKSGREALMQLPGVGRKIADCVLLFAYGFQEAFPVDVWILKALRQLYFPRRQPTPKELLDFTQNYFGPNGGYAQQYLFHYMRMHAPEEN